MASPGTPDDSPDRLNHLERTMLTNLLCLALSFGFIVGGLRGRA